MLSGNAQWGLEAGGSEPPTTGPGLHVAASVSLTVRTPALYGGNHEVHFNRGVTGQRFAHLFPNAKAHGSREAEQWKWLSRGLEEALLHFIEEAKGPGWQLLGALYEAHYVPVIRALAKARDRGVTVSLVVDWKAGVWSDDKKIWTQRGPQHLNQWALEQSGLSALHRTKPVSAISHNKFFILMSPTNTPVAVWTGSTNLTSGAIYGHSNVGHVLREPKLCEQYLQYWHKLKTDPEKKDIAAFNEEQSPLPEGDAMDAFLSSKGSLAIFSPRLRWARALDFFAQLISGAKSCVAFTAAFGISKDIAPSLLCNDKVLKYILLESEGQWAGSREAVRELRRRESVRVAMGTHLDEVPPTDASIGGWRPESLTGLNTHVRYVHTKILLIDPFSDSPIVITGSANFSRASMESNDENMIVVRGNTDLADAYAVEFFRIFEHMYFRNQIEAKSKAAPAPDAASTCKCGAPAAERVCAKDGPNCKRRFRACAKPREKSCGFFVWLDSPEKDHSDVRELPWPERCFGNSGFDCLERRALGHLRPTGEHPASDDVAHATASAGIPSAGDHSELAVVEDEEQAFDTEALEALGVLEDEEQADLESITEALAAMSLAEDKSAAPHPEHLVLAASQVAQDLLKVNSNAKGGTETWRSLRDQLRSAVNALPEQPARVQTLERLSEMERSFVAKTMASWRPTLRQILYILGSDVAAISKK